MLSEKVKLIKHKLEPKKGLVRIVPLGCIHWGHRAAMLDYAQGFVDYILHTPDTYTILMGDLVENVLPGTTQKHLGSMWEQKMTPEEQIESSIKMFGPLAKAGKILGAVEGNHSMRSWYAAGISPEREIIHELGLNKIFTGLDGLMELTIGEQTYVLNYMHGTGGTSTSAEVLKKIRQMRERFAGADIYLRGHHHMKVAADEKFFDARTGKLKKVFYVGTGSFLGYLGSYAQRSEYRPVSPGAPKIKLYRDEWDVHTTL